MKFFTKLSLVILCLIPLQVFSHSKLISSEPVHQAELTEAPKQVVLNFNRKVRLMKLELLNAAQEEALDIGFKPSPEKVESFTIELPVLAAGAYQAKWIAMSADSHKIKGEFSFAVLIQDTTASTELPVVTVYKSATCGCCQAWVSHLENNGFTVEAHDVGNMLEYKQRAKLGAGMGSCHTAFVDGYAVEGHVPAKDLKRMLLEKPAISGLTVPRMPIGSPGMEVPGRESDAFQVLGYKDGEVVGVFSDYPAGSVFE